MKYTLFTHHQLKKFVIEVFLAMGCSQHHAKTAAKVLTNADLRGIDSHGVTRLSGYVRLWENKRINTRPKISLTYETPSTAVIDSDQGLGLVTAPYAMKIAMEKAEKVGTGWVAVNNSNHYGIAGFHAMQALKKDMIGIAMTNASPLVAPTFSKERLLGTNPIAVAIPAHKQPAFVADLATTTITNGKLEIFQKTKQKIPTGWLQDAQGIPTKHLNALSKKGALLPLGSDSLHGSHKGYALGAMVDILSGVLSGANYGPWVPPFVHFLTPWQQAPGKGIGHFLGALRIDAFRPAAEFKSHMDQWIARFRSAKTIDGHAKVRIPGDPERETAEKRKKQGIPLLNIVVEDLKGLAQKFSIKF